MDDHRTFNDVPSPSPPAAFVTCAKCGASNPAVSEFCRQCGDAGVKPSLAASPRRRSTVFIALCASVLTAIPLIGLHFAIVRHSARLHDLALHRRNANLNVNLGKTQIALSAGKSSLRDAEAEQQLDMEPVTQNSKFTALQSERDRLKSDLKASNRQLKKAEDKYEEADRQLRNANGALRELREELEARNEQQARTMQKLTETERRLRSAEARNPRSGYRP